MLIIAERVGGGNKEDYVEYVKGIRSMSDHVINSRFTPETAAEKACKVMCLAASVLTHSTYSQIIEPEEYSRERLAGDEYKQLAHIRKRSLEAYGYLVEATRKLKGESISI